MTVADQPLPYQDRSRSADERTEDLLARMTLEEKVAQMLCIWQQKPVTMVDENGHFDPRKPTRTLARALGSGRSAGRATPAAAATPGRWPN